MDKELEQLTKTYKAGILNEKEFNKGKERIEQKLRGLEEAARKEHEGKKIVKEILEPEAKEKKPEKKPEKEPEKEPKKEPKKEPEEKPPAKEEPIIIEDVPEKEPAEPKKKVKRTKKKPRRKKPVKKAEKEKDEDSMFTRTIILAGIVFVILLIVLIKVFTGQGTPATGDITERNLSTVNGSATINMYIDIPCQYSKEAWDTMLKLKEIYGDSLTINVKQFPMSMDDVTVANAVLCANEQKMQMQYISRLFANQSKLDENSLKNYAWAEGLDVVTFQDCMNTTRYIDRIRADIKEGYEMGVRSTPVFFVDGQMLVGVQPIDKFQTLIDEKLGI